jgi:hypothetical protein
MLEGEAFTTTMSSDLVAVPDAVLDAVLCKLPPRPRSSAALSLSVRVADPDTKITAVPFRLTVAPLVTVVDPL